jgi:hypothetical protein
VTDITQNEGTALNLSLSSLFSDPEGDALTLNVDGLPGWATYNSATNTITGTPGAGAVNQSHTITVTGSSTGGSASDTFVLTINDAPDLTAGGGGNAVYSAGGGAIVLDPAIALADAEGNFSGGTLRVDLSSDATGVAGGSQGDTLSIKTQTVDGLAVALSGANITVDGIVVGSIDGTRNGTTDTTVGADTTGKSLLITFNANATTARIQAVLKSLQFENSEGTVTEQNRSISVTLIDANGAEETFTTTVEAYNNQRPNADDVSLNVNEDVTLTLTAANFSVNFSDGDGDTLQAVQITELPTAAQGKLQLNGNDIALNAQITKAQIDAGQLKFVPTADFNGNLTFKFAVGDGKQFDSTPSTATITVAPVDDAPRITANSGRSYAAPVARAILIDPGLALIDPDATGSATGTFADTGTGYIQVDITANRTSGDVLSINNAGTGAGQIGFDGTNITYAGVTIGTIDSTLDGGPNQAIKINLNGNASNDAVQALARAITIRSADRDQGTSSEKTITFTASDGENANTVGATRVVDFDGVAFDNFTNTNATRPVLSFDGSNDKVTMSANSVFQSGSSAFTMEGWINTSLNSSAIQTIFSVGSTSATQSVFNSSFSSSSGLTLGGNATVTGGVLRLTTAANNQSSTAAINPTGNAEGARNFTASFDLKMGESTSSSPADGFSFSYGNTLFNAGVQEGISDGLSIAFDTFVNGGETVNGIDVIVNGSVVHSAVVTGGTRTSKSTHAAEFDGVNDILYRGLDTALNQTGDVTVEAWIKPSALTNASIVAIGGPSGDANAPDNNYLYILQMTSSGQITMLHEDSDRVSGSPGANQSVSFNHTAISTNQWTHVAVSRDISGDGGTYRLYLNGQFVDSATYDYDPDGNGSSAELTIGGELVDGGGIQAEFNGQIDDVRIWDDVRTGSEISANYDKEITSSGSNLIANYTFDNSLTADESSFDGAQTLTNSGASRVAITDSKIEAEFVSVTITHNDNGLTVTYDGVTEVSNLNLGGNYAPQDGDVFTLAASTGAANDLHAVDNLSITATDLGTRNAIAVQNGKLVFVTEETYGSASGNPTISDSGTTVAGAWHHVAATHDGNNTLKLYVDGQLAQTITGIDKNVLSGGANIGSSDSNSDYFSGLINEIRLWNVERSADQIADGYLPDFSSPTGQSALVGYWKAADISGSTITDTSSNSNNGSVSGATTTTTSSLFVGPNTDKWTIVEGTHSDSENDIAYIDTSTGELVVQNRELVRSAEQHKPSATDPLHVTGTFQFDSGTDGFMHVMTRADASSTDANGLPANGLNFSAIEGDDRILIDRFVGGNLSASVANSGNGTIDFRKDTEYSFDVYDDGSTVRMTVTEVGNSANTVTITATDTTDFSGSNYVVLTGREDTDDGDEQVVRFDDIQIDNDIVLSEGATHTGTLPSTGLTGPFTFAALGQPEHGTFNITDTASGAYTYTPTTGYHGQDTISIQVTDANGAINVHQVSFAIDADLDVQIAGKQLDFDGTNDFMQVADNNALDFGADASFTIEYWVNMDDVTTLQSMIDKGTTSGDDSNYRISIENSQLRFWSPESGNVAPSTATLSVGEWAHVAVTYDGTANQMVFYVNGEQAGAAATVNEIGTINDGPLLIGRDNQGRFLNGQMDELRIWSEARTADDIRLNYDQQLSGSEANLQAYYRFDDVGGDTVADKTANGLNGTLGTTDTLGDSAEPTVVDPAENAAAPIYGNTVDTAENTAATGAMAHDNSVLGTVTYAIDNGAGGTTTSFTTAKNGTVAIDAATGNWTYTPATNYAGSDSFTLIANGATSGSDSETISVSVAGGTDENSIGMPDGMLQMDGDGDYVNLGSPSQLAFGSNAFSVETWIRTGTTTNARINVAQLGNTGVNDQGAFLFIENGKFAFDTFGSTDLIGTSTVNDQAWHHVAVTREGTTVKIYVDGNLEATGTYTFTVPQGATSISSNDSGAFNGEMDEFRIWSDARTDAEIAANYQKQLAGNENNLTAYYRFDDDPDGTAVDNKATSTGSALDGTLTGNATIKNIPAHAADFSGSGNYIEVTNPSGGIISGTGSLTYETWIKTDETTLNTIMGTGGTGGGGATLRINGGIVQFNNTGINAGTGEVFGTSQVNDGLWHHVAIVYDSTTGLATVYVDGVAEAAGDAKTMNITSGNLVIGDSNNHTGNNFGGQLANTRFWTTARTADEIADNMNNVLNGDETGLATQYLYDEIVGGAFVDSAGANNGTITGTVNVVDAVPTVQGTIGEIQEDASLSGQMSANDVAGTPAYSVTVAGKTTSAADADGRVSVETANGGTVTIDTSSGAWTYKPASNWYGTDSFNLTASGDNSTSDSETISVTVNNDAENSIVVNDGAMMVTGESGNNGQAALGTGTITNAMTLEFKVNATKVLSSTVQYLVTISEDSGSAGRYLVFIDSTGNFNFQVRDNDGNPSSSIGTNVTATTDRWYDVAVSYDGSNGDARMYIDGNLVGQGTIADAAMSAIAQSLLISSTDDGSTPNANILIDEVKVWSEVRTHEQIRDGIDQPIASGTTNLEAYYRFDDQVSGNAVQDQSGNNRDLTLNGNAKIIDDLKGGVSMDGVDDVITIANDTSLDGAQGTYSIWFKSEGDWANGANPDNAAALFSRHDSTGSYNGLTVAIEKDGDINIQGKDANSNNSAEINASSTGVLDGAWHQLTFVYDQAAGGLNKLYIDGVLIGSVRSNEAWNWNGQDLLIGDGADPYWAFFKGEISSVQVYNTKLTDAQVAAQFGNEIDPAISGLVGSYDFTEGTGTTAANDATGGTQTPDATVSGATWLDLDNDTTATTLVIQEDEVATGRLLGNDVPGTPAYGVETAATNGTVTVNTDGTWHYKPVANFYGSDTFTLKVTSTDADGTAFSDTETVTVTINSVDDGNAVQISDGALSLDGTNDWVDLPNTILNATQGTVSLRVNLPADAPTGSFMPLFANRDDADGDRVYIFAEFTGAQWHIKATLDDQTIDGGVISTGTWYETTLTWRTDNTGEFYVDGDSKGSVTGLSLNAGTNSNVNDGVGLGTYNKASNNQHTKALIDEVSVWSTAKTPSEIRNAIGQQLSGSESNLTAYYRFDDDTDGNVIQDLTGNGNNGTLMNGADIVDPASGAEPAVLGNAIEIQSSEVAAGTMTGIDVPGTPAYSIVGGTTTFTTAKGGSVAIDAANGTWTYTPASGFYGDDSFTLRATSTSDSTNFTDDETITVLTKSDNNVELNEGVLQVDAQNSWANVGDANALDITGDLTLEAWINPQGPGSSGSLGGVIAGKENAYLLSRNTDGSIQFALNGPGGTWNWTDTGYDAPLDTWAHLAMTYDASARTVKLYANGELVSTSTDGFIPTSLTSGTGAFAIGGRPAIDEEFDGLIDDVRVWNDLRSADEIRENYDQKLSGSENGLAGYWNFDDINGTTVQDGTANNNDGTLAGNAKAVPNLGQALDFDGTSTFINAGRGTSDSLAIAGDLTVETWAKFDAISGTQGIIDFALNDASSEGTAGNVLYQLTLKSDGDLEYAHEYGNGSNSTTMVFDTNLAADQWYHIAMTRDVDTKTIRLFVDGTLVGTAIYSTDGPEGGTNSTLIIGGTGAGTNLGDNKLNGQLSDLRIWNTTRTGEQIAANMNNTMSGNQNSALAANYRFDEGTGSTAADSSGVSGNVTISGTAAWMDTTPDINGRTVTIDENQTLQGEMSATGADGSATFSAGTPSNGGTVSIDSTTGNWTYIPAENYHGTETFTLTATGTQGTVDTETITVTIAADAAQTSPVSNNGVLALDGTNDYVNIADNASLDIAGGQSFTFESWIHPNDLSGLQVILDKTADSNDDANYRLFLNGDKLDFWSPESGNVNSGFTVPANTWSHVAVSYDASADLMTFYVNGEQAGPAQSVTVIGDVNAGPLHIGTDSVGIQGIEAAGSRYFDGMLDDVRIWRDVRTTEEIRDNYDHLVATNADNLAGNWIFDGSNGTTITDRTSNDNDGTLTNGAKVNAPTSDALSFDGGDYVAVGRGTGDELALTGNVTVEGWFNIDRVGVGDQRLVSFIGDPTSDSSSENSLYELIVRNDGTLSLFHESGAGVNEQLISSGTIDTGQWIHIAAVRDATSKTQEIYVNGELFAARSYTNNADGGANASLYLGASGVGGVIETFEGDMADVRIWNTARTSQQIADNFDSSFNDDQSGAIVANYKFDSADGQTVKDSAGDNDGTLGAANTAGSDDPAYIDGIPQIHGLNVAIQENSQAQGTMTSNDVVPSGATFGVNSANSHSGTTTLTIANKGTVAIDGTTGDWTFTPVDNFNGEAQFYLTASGGGLTDAEQITVTVQPVSETSNTTHSAVMQFDGTDDFLTTTASGMQTGTGAFTLETWFNSSMTGRGELVNTGLNGASQGARLFLNNGNVTFGDSGGANQIASTGTFNDGAWHHVAASYDGTRMNLYVDGELVAVDESASLNIGSGDISLGATLSNAGGGNYFNGLMGETRLWSTARSSEEVRENYTLQVASNTTGLQAQYTFADRNGSTVNDATSNNNDLKVTSEAATLNGTNQGFTVSDDASLNFGTTASFTLESWFNTSASGDYQRILLKNADSLDGGQQYSIDVDANGYAELRFNNNSSGSTFLKTDIKVNDGTWHHMAAVFDNANDLISIYVDGQLNNTLSTTDIPKQDTGDLGIGYAVNQGGNTPGQYFNGQLDDIRIWNTARTADQIADNFQTTLTGNQSGALVAHYTFDAQNGNDSAGSNNGSDLNSPTYTSAARPAGNGPVAIDNLHKALSLNGTSQHMHSATQALTQSSDVTIESWINWDGADTANINVIAGLGTSTTNGVYIGLFPDSGSQYLGINLGGVGTIKTSYAMTAGDWAHVSVSRENGEWKFYVNGAQVAVTSGTATSSLVTPSNDVWIGHSGFGNEQFGGKVADVRIWNDGRTATEIADNYNKILTGNQSGDLVVHYDFESATGTTVTDLTTGNDGTLSGNPTITDVALDILTNTITVGEDQSATGIMTASDVVGTASYSVSMAATNGTVSIDSSTGEWTYTPNSNYSGSDSFQLRASGGGLTDTETISVSVTADNDPNIAGSVLQLGGGTNDYAVVAHDNTLNATSNGFTVEFWMNGSGGGANAGILDKMDQTPTSIFNGWKINLDGTGTKPAFYLGDTDAVLNVNHATTVTDGAWHHIAAVYDGTANTIEIYVDGVASGSPVSVSALTVSEFANTDALLIGEDDVNNNPNYKGMLDDIRIWSDARTAGEISNYKDKLLSGDEANLVAYYTMESPDGTTITDKTGNNRTGTLEDSNGVNIVTLPTSAIDLDGTGDYVTTPVGLVNNLSTGTIETWVYLDSLDSETIFTKQHDGTNTYAVFSVGHTSNTGGGHLDGTDGKVYFRGLNAGGTLESETTLQTGQWYHLAITFTGSEARLYINGDLDKTQSGDFAIPDDTAGGAANESRIGSWKGVSSDLDGKVGDFRVWNDVRTSDEVAQNFNHALTGNESGLLANYQFEEIDGTNSIVDSSPNANTGTTGGGPTIVDPRPDIQGNAISLSTADTASGTMTAADVTGEATFTITDQPDHGTISLNSDTGDWTYTPTANYIGSDSFTIRATGATSGTDDETITLTVTASTAATNSPTQSALQFDGVDDYVDIGPMSENISGAYTFEAWVYYNPAAFTDNNWMRIIDLGQGENDDNLLLAIDPGSDQFSFDTRNGGVASAVKSDTTAPTGQWIHVAAVNDGDPDNSGLATGYLYINGELVKTETDNQQIAQDVARLNNYIGQSNWPNESNMHGAVADMRIWNDARTSDEIKANYNKTLTGSEDSLVAYYTFEDIENGVVRDITNNNNDAQVINNGNDPGVAATGPTGDVLQVNGSNNMTTASDPALAGKSFTIEFWANRTSADTGDMVYQQGPALTNQQLGIGWQVNTNRFQASFYNNDLIWDDPVGDVVGEWHHWAVTYDVSNNARILYKDGVAVANDTATSSFLGAGTANIGVNFNGQIDNFRIWHEARSVEEIRDGMSMSYDYDTSNLVAQYTFDDVNGSTVRDSAFTMAGGGGSGDRENSNDGTLANGATVVDSGAGGGNNISFLDKAIHFDGTNDSASTATTTLGPSGAAARTIMLWARTSSDGAQSMLSYGGGGTGSNLIFGLNGWDQSGSSLEGGKGVSIDIGGAAITFLPETATDDGQWHHYTLVLPSGSNKLRDLKVYQDGVLLRTVTALYDDDAQDVTFNTTAGAITLGDGGSGRNFNGDMAEVSIWGTDLTTAQIQQYMNQELNGSETGLNAYWRGSDNGSGAVNDYAGSNDLTLNNGASIVDVAPDITSDSVRISEDTIATGQLSASGVNSSATYSVQSAAGNGTVTIDSTTGVWNYTPNAGYAGTDTFTLRATGNVETEDEVISVRVGQDPVLPSNYALTLDGTDDYVQIGNDIANGGSDGLQSFTVEMWIKVGSTIPANDVLAAKGNDGSTDTGWSIRTGTDYIEVRVSDADGDRAIQNTNGTTISEGWHHVAMVVDRGSNTIKGYLDGSATPFNDHGSIGGSLANVGSISSTMEMLAGATDGGASATQFFNGSIGEIRVWDDARTSTEIANSYDKQLNGDEQGLAGYWTFEEGTGNVANDQSGNGNDASIIGGTHENLTSISMSAGATYKGLILGADADSNDTLSYSVSSNANGTLNLDTDGSFEYTNTTNADDSFDVTITDSDGNQTIETINIDVP